MNARSDTKLMVTVKLELADAVKVRWLAGDAKPGHDYKARLLAVTVPGRDGAPAAEVAVDSTHVVEATIPEPREGPDRYAVMFTGYFELPPGHADRPRLEGLHNARVSYRIGFVRADGALAREGQDYELLAPPRPATLSAAGHS